MPDDLSRDRPDALTAEVLRFMDALEPAAAKLIVAVSGGPDSTALLHSLACEGSNIELLAVHVNHHLRGDASNRDAVWLEDFCRTIGVRLIVIDGEPGSDALRSRGVEAAARDVRYRILQAEKAQNAADYVATAHTRSDQAETVLLRLITGRGTWRLSGIVPRSSDGIIRPLLQTSRTDVSRYLAAHGIDPCHDESNNESRFLRNRIRSELLPLIRTWNPRIEEMLADTASLEHDRGSAFEQLLGMVRPSLLSESAAGAVIRTDGATHSPHILRALLLEQVRRLDPSSREVDAAGLSSVIDAFPGTVRTISSAIRATRGDGLVSLERVTTAPEPVTFSHSIEPGGTIVIPASGFAISLRPAARDSSVASANRLRQVIEIPFEASVSFEIRNRRPGDRFRPLGMNRDKNLADFLIDRRIPTEERDFLPLLVCNESIAWIAGVEVSEEFKVHRDDGTRLEVVAERIVG